MASQDELKKQVGYKAVDDYVRSGTVIGLGTGSTAYFAVERVGQKLKSGELKDILAVPTSIRTKEQAESLGIPLTTLDSHSKLDVAIDGADAVDPRLNLIKGGGGAHFREKIVEMCASKFIVIVDDSKMCDGLGPSFPVPVEIVSFCHEHTMRQIAALPALKGCEPVLRLGSSANNKPDGDKPAVTDNGNYIVDLKFTSPIKNPKAAAEQLKSTIGVVEHGFFCGMATACIIAGKDGISVKTPGGPNKLKKARTFQIGKMNPDSKGFTVVGKVLDEPKEVPGKGTSKFFEVTIGDSSGKVICSLTDTQVEKIKGAKAIICRNASVRMINSHIRVVVDKWGKVESSDEEFDSIGDKNVSDTEFELVK